MTKRKPGPAPNGREPFHTWMHPDTRKELDMAAARLTIKEGRRMTRADVLELAIAHWLKT